MTDRRIHFETGWKRRQNTASGVRRWDRIVV